MYWDPEGSKRLVYPLDHGGELKRGLEYIRYGSLKCVEQVWLMIGSPTTSMIHGWSPVKGPCYGLDTQDRRSADLPISYLAINGKLGPDKYCPVSVESLRHIKVSGLGCEN